MTLEDLDPGGAAEDGREQGRVVDVGVPGERGVQRQEPLHFFSGCARHLDISHSGTVM